MLVFSIHADVVVLSAIINVDQEVEEPWPLQIYDHDRNSYVVFMQPGMLTFPFRFLVLFFFLSFLSFFTDFLFLSFVFVIRYSTSALIHSLGDVVLYESAVAIHGRPLALNGKYMANIFAHTKPKGWSYNKGISEEFILYEVVDSLFCRV
jgi:prolyl 4-hydroxylase